MRWDLLGSLAISLFLTIVLETGFFLLAVKWNKKDLLLVILINIVTNPIVVLFFWLSELYTNLNSVVVMAPLELFAVLVEGHCYKKYGQSFKHPYLLSLAANAFSFGIGMLIQLLIVN
ncbi:MAG: hypothetical protein LBH28_00975 [Oscillospiraceae bacterium]|jgi:presenilin-like A22 family membrane protease|nr:hypothetical protein [Oscillospiraceae bacterium]